MEKRLILKPGREKAVLRRHPWVFSGAIQQVLGDPAAGETVLVQDAHGHRLGKASYSPSSQIRARMWTWDPEMGIDGSFFQTRLERAITLRAGLPDRKAADAWRLVHGESDGLPGLIVDRYADVLSVQLLSAGIEFWRETLLELLVKLLQPAAMIERSDADVRELEGLPLRMGWLYGQTLDGPTMITEYGLHYDVDVAGGHKTGFYLDQRVNRSIVRRLAQGKRVLDCFCYTGGFAVNALFGGAESVLGVDASAPALDAAAAHVVLNGLDTSRAAWQQGDVFQVLRDLRDRGITFDMVILDPPKFAPTAAQVKKAARGYKDINLLGMKLLNPGGLLVTFSCSGGVSRELFQKIVAGAALDAGVHARVLQWLSQAPDHPVALEFPEGEYLKGLVIQVD